MASRIPIRRPRTLGAENENARPTAAPARAKILGRAVPSAASSKPGPGTKTAALAGASDVAVASVPKGKSKRLVELEALGSAKRKRQALQELGTRKNQSGTGALSAEKRRILGLPKKNTATAAVAQRPARPQVFVPPPVATAHVSDAAQVRRSSNRPSLIPVRQPPDTATVDLDADEEEEPHAKRQRTSSVGPEDVLSEAEIAAELALQTDDDEDAAYLDAEPDSAEWEDLDAADWDDPMMASEYVADIQRYLKEVELTTLPPRNYMASQTALTWDMRALLNDWLLQVHTRFHLLPETLFLSTHLIDRFLSLRAVAPGKLQLVGMACLLLASKYEETVSPAIANFTQISDGAFSNAEMQQAEQHVLRTLGKAEGYQTQTRQLGKYLAEIVLVEERLVGTPPSLLAAAAMWLARLALGEGDWLPASSTSAKDDDEDATVTAQKRAYVLWTPTLAHYATYAEAELLPAARHMLRYVLQPVRHESFYRKWAGKRNMKVSVYMREWALARWAEGSKPDLALELPALKREMRALQVRKEREAEAKRVRGEAGAEGGEEEDGEEDAEE
ncbi:cyclin-like protein [Mycena olivaceomarginata]|nr:cyclin-like protein [Mycena olivaceomarginata]